METIKINTFPILNFLEYTTKYTIISSSIKIHVMEEKKYGVKHLFFCFNLGNCKNIADS